MNITAEYEMSPGVFIYIRGLVKSNLYQAKGDSGGIVFIPRLDTMGGSIPVGILSGGLNGGNRMYFTSINDLPSSLQMGRY